MSSRTSRISTACSTRFSTDHVRTAAAFALLLLICAAPVRAQADFPWRSTVWQENFTAFDSSPYYLGTDSRHDAATAEMVLTPEEAARSGRLFLARRLPIEYFDMRFRARFGVNASFNGSGADGIVMVFAAVYDYPPTGGGALDFDGCLGYGVEFDTYQNADRNDPSPEHVAVLKDRSDNHLHHETLAVPTVEDGGWHEILIRFRGGYVEAWLDGVRRLNTDIAGFFPFDGYFGFTSGTGSAFNEHRIDDVSLSAPTMRSTDYGLHDVCTPVVIDSVLRVRHNHPEPESFTVTDAVIRSSTPGVFTIPGNPAPFLLTPATTQDVTVRATITAPGMYTGILELRGDNGERAIDTVRIQGDIPRLRFAPASVSFAITRLGDSREADVVLRNIGIIPARVEGLQSGSGAFRVLSPASFPVTIAPGEELPVRLRFTPTSEGTFNDTLRVTNSCGDFTTLAMTGTGHSEIVGFSFAPRSLLLQPGAEGRLALRADSLPLFTAVREISGVITYEDAHARYRSADATADALPAGSSIDVQELSPSTLYFHISAPSAIADTGEVLVLRFAGALPGPPCAQVQLASVALNADSILTGPPALIAETGKICVNGSCRHPFGLVATGDPVLQVSPHPAVRGSRVLVTLPAAGMLRLRLRDLLGRTRAVLAEGYSDEGSHAYPLPTDGIPAGCYMLELDWNNRRMAQSVLLR